ncbi:DMT family transporter [Salisediminibacterium halotolerans]|uniref:Threonine/homoserine efflux transporter RhtA n=1 Tax=Salisediminibacterium halotolerans TaxID=517425 RepID=A0A1H9VJK2_9BACI|nr:MULTISPECIES: DMT family transporter [Salisediminibacterium]RLJ75503.1 threonine/homoserine efflux transporter RhtA [Actinophytocola xinjiangensis]RPE89356.1 threonine/homoserine efflux transporter RhtA [Salisediminibacterium halotolerans]TWG36116.1 threonine/homoserine efflux transporter RhtA [Salisediminibacterium halotolerans]SES21966.1 Threonine/homoserine efflux transporter RhtA [Salisediminibacterium haloalkalitolerans]GEL08042.1 EamA family transporter [Salisediminibacterium halotole
MKLAGLSLILLAAVSWGISGGIADILMSKGWDPVVISFYRGAVGLLFFVFWFLFRFRQNLVISKYLFLWSAFAGVGVAGNFTFYFLSIEAASVAVAATLMYTAPVFVFLVSFLLKIERSTLFKWVCITTVLLGIVMLTGAYDPSSVSVSPLGTVAGLASGISYAVFIFGFKNASSVGNPQASLTVAFFFFCLILFVFADASEVAAAVTSSDTGWFLLLGIVGAGLSFIFYVIGLRWTPPTTASMVAMLEPVTASLFGVLLLGDHMTLMQVLGMAVILGTVTVLSVKPSK